MLRMKGRGVLKPDGHGDELIKLKVMLPQAPDEALEAFLGAWTPSPDYDPSAGYAVMVIHTSEFLVLAQLDHETLEMWIEEEWLVPLNVASGRAFSEVDLARAQLIHELMRDLGVNDDGVGVVLHLLDQIHGLRKLLAHASESTVGIATMPDVSSLTGDR